MDLFSLVEQFRNEGVVTAAMSSYHKLATVHRHGDDVESDIGGAKAAGLKTALVQTGKYREDFVKQTEIKADLMLPSIADLPDAIKLL